MSYTFNPFIGNFDYYKNSGSASTAGARIRVYKNTSQTIPMAAITKVQLDGITHDVKSEWNLANYRWVCSEAGYYEITARISLVNSKSVIQTAFLAKNGATTIVQDTNYNTTVSPFMQMQDTRYYIVGDYIELMCLQMKVGGLVVSTGDFWTILCVNKL